MTADAGAAADAQMAQRVVLGVMTGTSLDGIDAAAVAIRGHGLAMRAELLDHVAGALGPAAPTLRALAAQQPVTALAIAEAMHAFAAQHVAVLAPLVARWHPDLIGVHGQTVCHAPPLSWQLFQPAPLHAAFSVPVVCDFRAADLAHGGQGAPLTPLADWILYRRSACVAVVNLGGFANATVLPPDAPEEAPALTVQRIRGADLCACNQLLDAIARQRFGCAYDADGATAARGQRNPEVVARLIARLDAQQRAGRSLGTGDELLRDLAAFADVNSADLAHSAALAIAEVIDRSLPADADLILAGGGTRHAVLVAEFRARRAGRVCLSDAHGIPAVAREAAAFAVLAALCADGVPIALPQITGARRAALAGTWIGVADGAGVGRPNAEGQAKRAR